MKLKMHRETMEKELKRVLTAGSAINQLALSANACGCVALTTFPLGVNVEDIELLKAKGFIEKLKRLAAELGVVPKNVSFQRGENFEILQLKVLDFCKRCEFEYEGERPWPDVSIIENRSERGHAEKDALAVLSCRGAVEEELRRVTGFPIYVSELSVFALKCGCVGLSANIRGLRRQDLTEFPYFREAAQGLGVMPKIVYARFGATPSEIIGITARDTCERCEKYTEGLYLL